ncbi:MAG: recombinase RecJ [Brevinematales bacterium]|nr:recombinase RecJ [Brevinematales bacterium]
MINELIDFLRRSPKFYIQTHDFPDADAVASAFALRNLFLQRGFIPVIVYAGEIQTPTLMSMIERLQIPLVCANEIEIFEHDYIVIVDGCKGNKNVTDLPGDEIAVIDHHLVSNPESVKFTDIRPHYGSCSTIIASYYHELDEIIPRDIATALYIGLEVDTALLTRKVSPDDVEVFGRLFELTDHQLANTILRNHIQTEDLRFYKYAIDHIQIKDRIGFCYFPQGCNQNLLGILGDFFLALREVNFMILCARNGEFVNVSIRSEVPEWNASRVIRQALEGIGNGGGHAEMAGGLIRNAESFKPDEFYAKIESILCEEELCFESLHRR